MNLDDLDLFRKLDTRDMLGEIDRLPDQLQQAWEFGMSQPPPALGEFRSIVIAGMGAAAAGAELAAAAAAPHLRVPLVVHREYGLPAFAQGPDTLVICSDHSGGTEETLDSFEAAVRGDCSLFVICGGGDLAARAAARRIPLWRFEHRGPPQAAIGFSFGLVLALLARCGLIPDPAAEVAEAVAAMKRSQQHLRAEVPAVHNPAKRYAGQLMGRWVTVMGAGGLAAVARRWKSQINELARAGANFEVLPEADHNARAGLLHPPEVLNAHTMTLFLVAPSDDPRNRRRSDQTRQAFMLEGLNTDGVEARGDSPTAHLWTLVLFGDYMACYLALACGMDPGPA